MKDGRETEGSALNLAGFESHYDFGQTSHRTNHDIAIRHKSVLPKKHARKEVGHGPDPADADDLPAEFLNALDVWLGNRKNEHFIDRDRDVSSIRSRKSGIDARRTADRRNIDASAQKRLNGARAVWDINQLDIQAVALKYSCLLAIHGIEKAAVIAA